MYLNLHQFIMVARDIELDINPVSVQYQVLSSPPLQNFLFLAKCLGILFLNM